MIAKLYKKYVSEEIRDKVYKAFLGDILRFFRGLKGKLTNAERAHKQKVKFYSQFVSPNDLCFDVGANMGNRTEILLQLNARVVAVEPQKKCYEYLRQKFGDKINLVTKGLGDVEEEKTFYISDVSVLSSFSKEWIDSTSKERFKANHWDHTEQIKMTTLDKLIEQYGVPHFIKIDVEGFELEVLKGLSHPINMISFEYTFPEAKKQALLCIVRIEKINRNIVFNYSIGESMKFALSEWITSEEMIKLINSKKFSDSAWGDIYAKKIKA
ncbi:hypothetical protein FACS189446_7820 [Bacteroidia bacterium]|nr:hypothetical protein FACS189446_7820 [Bacteroidia bacterium]